MLRSARAVSRVDVLFIRAEKDPATGAYARKAGRRRFRSRKLAGVKLSYTGANSRLGLSGEKSEGIFDVSHTIASPGDALTMGTGPSTVVGVGEYDFENVRPADIISGSAHLRGTCLIPNGDDNAVGRFHDGSSSRAGIDAYHCPGG